MVKDIVRDVFFLSRKSTPATRADIAVGRDLMDTLAFNRARCVGLAANMIGVNKNIIIVNIGFADIVMFNPVITAKEGPYETEEGCLSLEGTRPCTRYESITVEFTDMMWQKKTLNLKGFPAEIVQHEVDHLSGIII